MEKFNAFYWQTRIRLAILFALCLGFQSANAETDSSLLELEKELAEVRLAFETTNQKNKSLEVEISRVKSELQEMRKAHTELAVKNRNQAEELKWLRLGAAQMLDEGFSKDADRELMILGEMLLEAVEDKQELADKVVRFDDYLNAVLEALQPSDVVRNEIASRYDQIKMAVDRLGRLPPEVARRGGVHNRLRREARILAVNDELNLVIIDAGAMHGVRHGSIWRVLHREKVLGTLRVISLRQRLSAAVPIEGKLEDLTPGLLVRFGLESDSG